MGVHQAIGVIGFVTAMAFLFVWPVKILVLKIFFWLLLIGCLYGYLVSGHVAISKSSKRPTATDKPGVRLYGVRPEAMRKDYPMPMGTLSPPFVGKWGVLGYFVPDGLMHPEDVKRYIEGGSKGEDIYQCTKDEGHWVTIRNNLGETFRVNPYRLIWIPEPMFDIGAPVFTKAGTPRRGWIRSRNWHYKEKKMIYYIEIPGTTKPRKKDKRRYWENELAIDDLQEN